MQLAEKRRALHLVLLRRGNEIAAQSRHPICRSLVLEKAEGVGAAQGGGDGHHTVDLLIPVEEVHVEEGHHATLRVTHNIDLRGTGFGKH